MKMNKKGFTIVELVIVIAVIAILAGVMIPTFGGVIADANEKAALQEATGIYKEIFIANAGAIDLTKNAEGTAVDFYIIVDAKYAFKVVDGNVELATDVTNFTTPVSGYEAATAAPYTGTKATAIWVPTTT